LLNHRVRAGLRHGVARRFLCWGWGLSGVLLGLACAVVGGHLRRGGGVDDDVLWRGGFFPRVEFARRLGVRGPIGFFGGRRGTAREQAHPRPETKHRTTHHAGKHTAVGSTPATWNRSLGLLDLGAALDL